MQIANSKEHSIPWKKRKLVGQNTVRYLGVEVEDALALAESIEL